MNDTATLEQKEKSAQFLWTGFIIAFFVIQAIIWIIAITFTANDPSHQVLPNYDQSAINWKDNKQALAQSAALGWKVELKIDPLADIAGNRALMISINDQQTQPVNEAQIDLQYFHRGRAGEIRPIEFEQVGEGLYSSLVKLRREGWYQFEGTIERGTDRYFVKSKQYVDESRRRK